jgi:hypothetical protein
MTICETCQLHPLDPIPCGLAQIVQMLREHGANVVVAADRGMVTVVVKCSGYKDKELNK